MLHLGKIGPGRREGYAEAIAIIACFVEILHFPLTDLLYVLVGMIQELVRICFVEASYSSNIVLCSTLIGILFNSESHKCF